ncbi:MAG: hypothetical protein PF485_06555 [Bacteroidales bacterium]|jgi:Ca2+/Na+ antiporter|nr:hypothetical protein [Bacteroidales bacterium]
MEKKNKYMDLNALISDMQLKDKRYKNIFKRFQIIFFVFIFIYGGLFLVNPDAELTINDRLAGGCYVIAFSLFAFYFRKYYKKYKEVNYSDSVKKVLTDAEKRYRFKKPDFVLVFIGIILIGIATVLVSSKFSNGDYNIIYIYILLLIIGISVGYLWWRKDNRPIWLSTKKLLKELDE